MNGDLRVGFNNGVPSVGYLFNTPIDTQQDLKIDMGVYGQDSWTYRRLTVNAGVRWEWFDTGIQAQAVPAGAWVPARTTAAVPNVPDWKTIVPRIGLSYDLFGKGKTVLKASASKYEGGMGVAFAQTIDPIFLTSETCTWTPPAGTTEASMAHGASIVAASTFTNCTGFNGGSVNTHVAPNVKRPHLWEYAFTVQQQIMPQLIVSAAYFFRPESPKLGCSEYLGTNQRLHACHRHESTHRWTSHRLQSACLRRAGQIYLALNNYPQLNSDYNGVEFSGQEAIQPQRGLHCRLFNDWQEIRQRQLLLFYRQRRSE